MLYTPMTKKALLLAWEAHKNQLDKTGMPYIFHPFHLAEQMDDEASVCVALLHDSIEDSFVTAQLLRSEGFAPEVVEAVELMTHAEDMSYMDYVERLKGNPIARKVKLADLRHNMDLNRLDEVGEADLQRLEKYRRAYEVLNSAYCN